MNKKGFILFTTLLYMTLLTALFLSNLSMYESQVKINKEIALAYESQTMARLAMEKIKLTIENDTNSDGTASSGASSETSTSVSESTASSSSSGASSETSTSVSESTASSSSSGASSETSTSVSESTASSSSSGASSETSTSSTESSASSISSTAEAIEESWLVAFDQGEVNVLWNGEEFSCQVIHFENNQTYTYDFTN
ncbi:hypothetical protein EF384_06150 [Aerococcus agrisoli]|uniref:Uncharacterized protein n=1 Tax=Aerococcus agrisoli TaxID=2487350 RepID=A0A3N4GFI1_9LACT|nr:hypothetical protein [Aerococcus agrisoli]RPA60137.1 hypothetical protein EF384_06150 [Aerococcus agrisoli]